MSESITPATKIAELLERWPELEPVLIAQAPAFAKLKNPVLRRTIARVATLEQAAAIAGLSPRELVATLRRAAGQEVDVAPLSGGSAARADAATGPCCGSVTGVGSRTDTAPGVTDDFDGPTIDADALLNAGELPLKAIFDAAAKLQPGQALRILSSFRPVPLIDRLEHHGYSCEVRTVPGGGTAVHVRRG